MNNSDSIKIEMPASLEFVCDQFKEFHRLKQAEREKAYWALWGCIFVSPDGRGIGGYGDVLRQNLDEKAVKQAFNNLLETL